MKRKHAEIRYVYHKSLGLIVLSLGAWSLMISLLTGSPLLFSIGYVSSVSAGAWLVVRYAMHQVTRTVEK